MGSEEFLSRDSFDMSNNSSVYSQLNRLQDDIDTLKKSQKKVDEDLKKMEKEFVSKVTERTVSNIFANS